MDDAFGSMECSRSFWENGQSTVLNEIKALDLDIIVVTETKRKDKVQKFGRL